MSSALWLSFVSYTAITAITPGPNNILALNTVSNYGMKHSKRLLAGIYSGFLSVMIVCGLLGSALASILPNLLLYLKYVGFAYILWLAWQVATSKPIEKDDNTKKSTGFFQGYILQFVNVKIIIAGFVIFTGFILPYYTEPKTIIGFAFVVGIIANSATHVWAIAGSLLNRLIHRHWRPFNITMSILLVLSALTIILE